MNESDFAAECAPCPTLVELYVALSRAVEAYGHGSAQNDTEMRTAEAKLLARLREADVSEAEMDGLRAAGDALADDLEKGIKIVATLQADFDQEVVNREAVQLILVGVVCERDAARAEIERVDDAYNKCDSERRKLADCCARLRTGIGRADKWLSECAPQIITHDHGVPYDHVGIAREGLAALLKEGT